MAQENDLEKDLAFMDRNSRMIGAFGLDVIAKMVGMKVLIVGCKGVGIEVAKNTVLAGVHTLTLHDPQPTAPRDLGTNFFLTDDDLGVPRATACAPRVAELNANVIVQAAPPGELTEALVAAHTIVVFTIGDRATLIKWNHFCRTRTPAPISFMCTYGGGAWGGVFVDHGDSFTIRDANGRAPLIKLVKDVEVKDDHLLIRYETPDGQPPEALPDDGLVEFDEIDGLIVGGGSSWVADAAGAAGSLNGAGAVRTSHPDKDPVKTVRVALPAGAGAPTAYKGGGVLTQKKEPTTVSFRSLEACLNEPGGVVMAGDDSQGFLMTDMTFSMVELQLHVAQQAVYDFEAETGNLPRVNEGEDARRVVELANAFEAAHGVLGGMGLEVDPLVCARVASHASVELQPMAAFFGGVVAQEVVKVAGKYTPIQQFLNLHAFSSLPDPPPPASETAPLDCRYDDLVAVYGRTFVERLGEMRIFMVGCGALGCEFIKNFALLGVCCGPTGQLTVTDNDRIEVSNLNRQFLFRAENVGSAKSTCAAKRAQTMNPAINIDSRQDLVSDTTEHLFNEDFWNGLDLVCNALDNMQARMYVDGRCIFFEKPLLESGTMGTGANVDIVVPHATRSYADGGAADEGGGVPMCTLRNFPHLIDHCIEWARAQFEDQFGDPAQKAQKVLEDVDGFIRRTRAETFEVENPGLRTSKIIGAVSSLTNVIATLEIGVRGPTMIDCVSMAWQAFHALFRDKILDLTDKFPQDATDSKGEPFWAGHKRFPAAAVYDPSNENHVQFLVSAANLFAGMLRVHPPKHPSEQNQPTARWMGAYRTKEWLEAEVSKLGGLPARASGLVDLEGDAEAKGAGVDTAAAAQKAEKELEELLTRLAALGGAGGGASKGFEPADFEKDDDDNFHIDFITACSNLRAANYHIPSASRHKCKMIAGRIIPAIATTTASVTGLVMLEMFKVLQGKPIEQLRNGNYDLGSNQYMLFEAEPPAQIADHVKIDKPNPADHPDAYDAKGELTDLYKDPDMGLGFAEQIKTFPNPHTKYDKIWVGPLAEGATVGDLKAALDAQFAEAGLTCSMIQAPSQKVECDKDEENPSGLRTGARTLYNAVMRSTHANLTEPWVALLEKLTTRSDKWLTVDEPIEVSKRVLFSGLTFDMQDADGDQVTTPQIVIKLAPFDFVPYAERMARDVKPWLDNQAKKKHKA